MAQQLLNGADKTEIHLVSEIEQRYKKIPMGLPLPFLNKNSKKKRAQIIAVDLGSRTTKAVLFERRGETLALTRYALLDAPIFDKKISPELLADHLRSVADALGNTTKFIAVALGLNDTLVRQVELPPIPADQMRQMLKVNHKGYLQQDLPNHVFDCCILAARQEPAEKNDKASRHGNASQKFKGVIAAAKQQLVTDFVQAAGMANLTLDGLIPGLIGPINAFELALPEIFTKETVALVDIGFKHSSVSVLDRGELALNRMVNIGGDHLTNGLAETMNISYAEAEGIKVGMAPEVEFALQIQIVPLGRELRASLDFFEHQYDRPVTNIYFTGGSARSEMLLQMLQAELMVECKTWNPTTFLKLALPGQQAVEVEQIGPQLTVAIGTALTVL